MKLLLEEWGENTKGFLFLKEQTIISFFGDFSRIQRKNLKKITNFFKLQSISILAIRSQR